MALQHGIFTLALSALLLAPVAAKADDLRWGGRHDASPVGVDVRGGQYTHNGGRYHPAPTPPPARPSRGRGQDGRYEFQTVQKWVPGHYEQVWVEQNCRYKPRRHETRCSGGYYDQRWVEGYYQPVQEWVWVPAPHRPYVVVTTRW
ncbi:hypothetical protein [Vitiosangium sp. GDMCC 1.1324]|uniref:hypothetical protein n=1 Tax=Vitiosangium sp. (strain GDMCC 1.1324) TaxID=2138576 RepID=UPI000D33284F|nr:hypothetical protein [Vitiosangium sp. GDMCC 1.1324]PTL83081.1 hypothetical protein DAT35_13780 [Vitiosangium sp. GDMCC 1.1324]